MKTRTLFPTSCHAATLLVAALAAGVVACGGLEEDAGIAARDVGAALTAVPPPGLIADDGSVRASLPEAIPADPGARTRAARYALREQAKALDIERRGDLIWLDVACCGFDAADTAVNIAHGLRAAMDLSVDAPVMVSGADLRLAAYVADRLEEHGAKRVFLVTR